MGKVEEINPTLTTSTKKKKTQQSPAPITPPPSLVNSIDELLTPPNPGKLFVPTPNIHVVLEAEKEMKFRPVLNQSIQIPPTRDSIMYSTFRTLSKSIWNMLMGLFSSITLSLLPYLILLGIVLGLGYYFIYLLRNLFDIKLLPSFSSVNLSLPLSLSFSTTILPFITTLYCSTIRIGCDKSLSIQEQEQKLSHSTRLVTAQAAQALDIFESVLAITRDENSDMGSSLVHTGLWELGTIVGHTHSIDNHELIGDQLMELGTLTRDVGDQIVRLNSYGINSFTWILNDFNRIESLVLPIEISTSSTTSKFKSHREPDLSKLLSSLFKKIETDSSALLKILDQAIPKADRASNLGGFLFNELKGQSMDLRRTRERGDYWAKSLQDTIKGTTWETKQLKRDLVVAEIAADHILTMRNNLEVTRRNLFTYSNNIGYFKAGIIGSHIAGQGLNVEEEIKALRSVMQDFRSTVAEAKRGSNRKIAKSLPHSSGRY